MIMLADKPLTALQACFVQNYADPGSETYNNGYQSAIKAGYSHKTSDRQIKRVLGIVGVKTAIGKYRNEVAKTIDWDRTLNMQALEQSLAGIDKILKDQPKNIQAWQTRTAIIREFNASSNQHASTVLDGKEITRESTPAERAAALVAAKAYTDALVKHVDSKVIEPETP